MAYLGGIIGNKRIC